MTTDQRELWISKLGFESLHPSLITEMRLADAVWPVAFLFSDWFH